MQSEKLISDIMENYGARELPPMIIFDVTNTCNLRCIHCPQPVIQKNPNFISRNLTKSRVIKALECIKDSKETILVRFAGDGEPMVNKDLVEMIEATKKHNNAVVNLTTNGTRLSPNTIERLLSAKIDLIDISIDAFSEETYNTVRVGGNFTKLMRNIEFLLEQIEKNHLKTKIMVSFVEQAENSHETHYFEEFWQKKVDHVMVRKLHSAVGAISPEKIIESQKYNEAGKIKRFPCPHLWKRLTIDFDGNIKFCAHEWMGNDDVILGNIDFQSIKETWQGRLLKNTRKMHLDEKFAPSHICDSCTDWASSKWDFGYEKLAENVVGLDGKLYPFQ